MKTSTNPRQLFKGLELFHKKFADKFEVHLQHNMCLIIYNYVLSEPEVRFLEELGWSVNNEYFHAKYIFKKVPMVR